MLYHAGSKILTILYALHLLGIICRDIVDFMIYSASIYAVSLPTCKKTLSHVELS
jgi:hypothetical protein